MFSFYDNLTPEKKRVVRLGVFFIGLYLVNVLFNPLDSGDVLIFFDYSQEFKQGILFDDGGFSEYPPLAWPFILLPGLFVDTLEAYNLIYTAVDVICMFVIALVLIRVCGNRTKHIDLLLIAYLIMTVLYVDQAVKKFDIIAVMMMSISLMMFVEKRYFGAVSFAIIGGLIKIFPFLLLPVFFIMVLRKRSELIATVIPLIAWVFGLAIAAAMAMALGVDKDIIFGFLTFQGGRGFHVESFIGTLSVVICHITGNSTTYVIANHTKDVDNFICDALVDYWIYIFLISMAAVALTIFIKYLKHGSEMEEGDNYKFLTSAVLAMLVTMLLANKVFSTQFIQWVYPLIVMYMCFRDEKGIITVAAVFCLTVAISRFFLAESIQEMLLFRDILLVIFLYSGLLYVTKKDWEFIVRKIVDRFSR